MGKPVDSLSVVGLSLAEVGTFVALVGWLLPCTAFLYQPTISLPDCVATHAVGDVGIGIVVSGVILFAAGWIPELRPAPERAGASIDSTRLPNPARSHRSTPVRAYLRTCGILLIVATYMIVGLWFLGSSSFTCAGCGVDPIGQSLVLGGRVETYGSTPGYRAATHRPVTCTPFPSSYRAAASKYATPFYRSKTRAEPYSSLGEHPISALGETRLRLVRPCKPGLQPPRPL